MDTVKILVQAVTLTNDAPVGGGINMVALSLELRNTLRTPDGIEQAKAFLKSVFASAAKPAAAIEAPKLARVLQYQVFMKPGTDWCEVQRFRIGAGKNKKPRPMHRSKVENWLASLERNGYAIQRLDIPEAKHINNYVLAMKEGG
jgi:hypothetical protein